MTRDTDTGPAPGPEKHANRPADVIRDSNLKATLWRNEGDKGPYYATELARTYKDDDGNLPTPEEITRKLSDFMKASLKEKAAAINGADA